MVMVTKELASLLMMVKLVMDEEHACGQVGQGGVQCWWAGDGPQPQAWPAKQQKREG